MCDVNESVLLRDNGPEDGDDDEIGIPFQN